VRYQVNEDAGTYPECTDVQQTMFGHSWQKAECNIPVQIPESGRNLEKRNSDCKVQLSKVENMQVVQLKEHLTTQQEGKVSRGYKQEQNEQGTWLTSVDVLS